jgi:hypothetical protein
MWLERLGKLKKSHYLLGTRTRDLPACSKEPQPTTLQCAPIANVFSVRIVEGLCWRASQNFVTPVNVDVETDIRMGGRNMHLAAPYTGRIDCML